MRNDKFSVIQLFMSGNYSQKNWEFRLLIYPAVQSNKIFIAM